MKAIDIREKSWHFWLASKVGWRESKYNKKLRTHVPTDFCYYVRRVILGIICASIWGSVIAGLIGLYLYSGYFTVNWIVDMIHLGKFFPGPREIGPFLFINGIALGVCLVLGIAWGGGQLLTWRYLRREARNALARQLSGLGVAPVPKEPSFVQVAYTSIKDKVCFRINIVDSE
jgi:hypothetical protein